MKHPYLLFFMFAAVIFAVDGQPVPPAPSPTPAQQNFASRSKRMTPEMVMKRVGGFLMPPYHGKYCYVMNAQARVGDDVFEWVIGQLNQVLSLPIRMEKCSIEGNDSLSPIKAAQAKGHETGAVISLIDVPGQPTLLVAPDDGWAQVNMAELLKDCPDAKTCDDRAKKEFWRAFIILFGGGNSRFGNDLMRPITSPKDLDSSPNLVSSPEPFNTVTEGARARGITPLFRTTYKRACREGWAPAPTNEFQRAIWEQVKSDRERGPTNPITIPPPSQKK